MLKEICNAAGKLARFPAPFFSNLPGLCVACDDAHETDPFAPGMATRPVEVNEDELPDRSAAQQGSPSSAPRLPAENGSPDADQSRAATRIALRPHDPGTGEEIDKREVVKGYEYGRGQFVTFTPRGIEGARCRKLEGDRSREVCAAGRPGSGLFRQLVLPLSGRPGRGRNAAGDRRGNGRSSSRRSRATHAKPGRADGCRRAARHRDGAFHFACRGGGSGGAVRHGRRASSTLRWSRSPRRLSRSGREVSIRRRIEIVTRRPCKN